MESNETYSLPVLIRLPRKITSKRCYGTNKSKKFYITFIIHHRIPPNEASPDAKELLGISRTRHYEEALLHAELWTHATAAEAVAKQQEDKKHLKRGRNKNYDECQDWTDVLNTIIRTVLNIKSNGRTNLEPTTHRTTDRTTNFTCPALVFWLHMWFQNSDCCFRTAEGEMSECQQEAWLEGPSLLLVCILVGPLLSQVMDGCLITLVAKSIISSTLDFRIEFQVSSDNDYCSVLLIVFL